MKGVWVNIWDFLEAKRAGTLVKRWPTEKALAKYTISHGLIYPKKRAKKSGPLRILLASIFRHGT